MFLHLNVGLLSTNMDERTIRDALQGAKEGGIRNIVALRGDPPVGAVKWEASSTGCVGLRNVCRSPVCFSALACGLACILAVRDAPPFALSHPPALSV